MPTLTIQLPGRPPVEHILRETAMTLGRAPGSAIVLDDSSVSQSHATITRIGGDYFLQDLQSTNGTLLNGQSIREVQLRDGDILKLGEAVAIFELRSTAAAAPTLAVLAASSAATPAVRSTKSDTAVLSAKARTSLLKPVSPGAGVSPAVPAPSGKSPFALVASLLGVVLVAGVVGFLAWMLVGGTATKPVVVTPPAPQVQAASQTNAAAEAVEPKRVPETPMPIAEATDAISEPETNNLPGLLAALRSPDVGERRHAAEAISSLPLGATNALLNLRVALLQDSDPEVRAWLVVALVNHQTYDQSAIPVLVEGLKQTSATLREHASTALGLIPYDEAGRVVVVPALKAAAVDDNEAVRKAALAALKAIAPGELTDK